MSERSLWARVKGAVSRFFGAETPIPSPPVRSPAPVEPEYQPPEPEAEQNLYARVPPEESGIPPEPEQESAYDELRRDMGVYHDPYASEMLWYGWFDMDVTPDQRQSARSQFFLYTDMDTYEFDWDEWRDWYEEVSG